MLTLLLLSFRTSSLRIFYDKNKLVTGYFCTFIVHSISVSNSASSRFVMNVFSSSLEIAVLRVLESSFDKVSHVFLKMCDYLLMPALYDTLILLDVYYDDAYICMGSLAKVGKNEKRQLLEHESYCWVSLYSGIICPAETAGTYCRRYQHKQYKTCVSSSLIVSCLNTTVRSIQGGTEHQHLHLKYM